MQTKDPHLVDVHGHEESMHTKEHLKGSFQSYGIWPLNDHKMNNKMGPSNQFVETSLVFGNSGKEGDLYEIKV